MNAQHEKKPLTGEHRKMEVHDPAAGTAGTAKPAEAGKTLPPNRPPDDNAPVTRGEFREEVHKLDKKIDATKAELKDDIHKLDKRIEVGFVETDKKIVDTKAELKDDFHKSVKTMLWTMVSIFSGLVVAVIAAMFGMVYYLLNTVPRMM